MILNPKTYSVTRVSKEFLDGVLTEVLSAETSVSGNLQPVTDNEIQSLPEGFRRRSGRKFKLYTEPSVTLQIAPPDRISALGTVLFVHGVIEWPQGLIPHRKWLLVEPETATGTDLEAVESGLEMSLEGDL